MPNWCSNTLEIVTDTPEQFVEVIQGITNNSDQPFDFNRVITMPEELRNTSSPNRNNPDELQQKYGFKDWYDWSCSNWGTKWNACDVELLIESPTQATIRFNTAWSPPTPVIEKIAEKFPFAEITHKYDEGGMNFYGEVSYSEGMCISREEGEMTCEWRWENWGECFCETDCGVCDCECGCEQNTKQTICTSCNENDHQNNNELPQFTNKEQRGEVNE